MSYKITITEENNQYKVIVNGKGVVYIKHLRELESAIKCLKIGEVDCD